MRSGEIYFFEIMIILFCLLGLVSGEIHEVEIVTTRSLLRQKAKIRFNLSNGTEIVLPVINESIYNETDVIETISAVAHFNIQSKRFNVRDKSRKWFIEPKRKTEGYIFYEDIDIKDQGGKCLNENETSSLDEAAMRYLLDDASEEDDPQKKKRFIQLILVSDGGRIMQFDSPEKEQESTLNIFAQVRDIYKDFGGEYDINIELAGLETTPRVFLGTSDQILQDFTDWLRLEDRGEGEIIHLLTGTKMEGGVIGIASLRDACYRGKGVVYSSPYDAITAKTLAHEIGHNIGLYHTNTYLKGMDISKCIQERSAVMSWILLGPEASWETCSNEWFKAFDEGYPQGCQSSECIVQRARWGNCLMQSKEAYCGNGILDEGEECDSEDNCCRNCKLTYGSECSDAQSPCCENCKFVNKICRKSTGDSCDLKDTRCQNGECPEPNFEPNGKECGNGGSCFDGKCVSKDKSCITINPAYGYKIRGTCGDPSECNDLYCFIGATNRCDVPFAPKRMKVEEGSPCLTDGDTGILYGNCLKGKCISVDKSLNQSQTKKIKRKIRRRRRWFK